MVVGEKVSKTREEWMEWLNTGSIVPYFQPILSIENKSVFGYESLARIFFPDGSVQWSLH